MKKFSNITGQKVGQEPKIETKQLNEQEIFKNRVIGLIDDLLSIRTYGPVDRHQRAGLIKIAGKEMLAEAIIDLLTEKTNKEKTKLLESLKSEIKDWQIIDEKINDITSKRTPKLSNINKFNSILESYEEESLSQVVESKVSKIKDKEILLDYVVLVSESKLSQNTKTELINLYFNRLQQLS